MCVCVFFLSGLCSSPFRQVHLEIKKGSVVIKPDLLHAPFNELKSKEMLLQRGRRWLTVCVWKHNNVIARQEVCVTFDCFLFHSHRKMCVPFAGGILVSFGYWSTWELECNLRRTYVRDISAVSTRQLFLAVAPTFNAFSFKSQTSCVTWKWP